tara:strand:- start:1229 stop:1858 length:630 start_codon:yes stop_codon:yes gene_type:complete
MYNIPKEPTEQVTEHVQSKSPLKTIAIVAGSLFALSHIGLLGYLLNDNTPKVSQVPVINIPRGPYSSYRIRAGKDGYEIEYRADDPKILESERSLDVDNNKRGWFGGGSQKRNEYRRDQYTREGTRNLGGTSVDAEGKTLAKSEECIRADAGARSQGAMAGSAIAAGVAVPALVNIPYIGWLAGGWALLLGQKAGSEIGSEVGTVFNDC